MTGGVATALGQVLEGTAEPSDLVQAGLFDELSADEIGALDAPSPLSAKVESPLAEAVRKGGRRPGSRNRRTEATVRWLLSQHRHPLQVMAEAYSMSTAELAARIGLKVGEDGVYANETLLELFKLQVRMAEALAPYVAQRLPQAVTVEGAVDFSLTVAGVSFPAPGGQAENLAAGEWVRLPPKSDDPSRTDG